MEAVVIILMATTEGVREGWCGRGLVCLMFVCEPATKILSHSGVFRSCENRG